MVILTLLKLTKMEDKEYYDVVKDKDVRLMEVIAKHLLLISKILWALYGL